MNPLPHLLIIGTAAVDLTAHVPALPQKGETLSLKAVVQSPGGKALNMARMARRLGGRVSLAGRVGSDAHGDYLVRVLGQEQIGLDYLERDPQHPTATSVITVDAQGENIILTLLGATAYLEGPDFANVSADVLVCQPEFDLKVLERVLASTTARVVLNLAPYHSLAAPTFGLVDTLVVNQVECRALLGDLPTTVDQLLEQVHGLANELALVVTLGSAGSLLVEHGQVYSQPAVAVKALSTVGAGDALVAGYALGLGLGESRIQALRRGSTVAAAVVQGGIEGLESLGVMEDAAWPKPQLLRPGQVLAL